MLYWNTEIVIYLSSKGHSSYRKVGRAISLPSVAFWWQQQQYGWSEHHNRETREGVNALCPQWTLRMLDIHHSRDHMVQTQKTQDRSKRVTRDLSWEAPAKMLVFRFCNYVNRHHWVKKKVQREITSTDITGEEESSESLPEAWSE